MYALDFGPVTSPGAYEIAVSGSARATSPQFRIDAYAELFSSTIADSLFFLKAQRDGAEVIPSVLSRRASHLHDAQAFLYDPPAYEGEVLQKDLTRVGGPVDVAGGWFDAGDYMKFVTTQSYVLDLLLVGVRDHPDRLGPRAGTESDFTSESRFGPRVARQDVGRPLADTLLPSRPRKGDACVTSCGDHDVWRLPEEDDDYKPEDPRYRYLRNRPVFRAGPPGSKISPNLAGRLTAAFALAFQVYKQQDPELARRSLTWAAHIYDLADTDAPEELVASSPQDFYEEETWEDDLELGAAEMYLALASGDLPSGLPHPDPAYYLRDAARWAKTWIAGEHVTANTFNLYDTSALAHYELFRAVARAGDPTLGDMKGVLLDGLRRPLDKVKARADTDPFGAAYPFNAFDGTSHFVGLALSASFYDELSHTHAYASFGRHQLAVALGANPWGISFVVGTGAVFPHCVHHQIGNLSGSLLGTAPLLRGAAVNGPNEIGAF